MQEHMISNIEYAILKVFNFAVNLLNSKPILVLFDTRAMCLCTSYDLF